MWVRDEGAVFRDERIWMRYEGGKLKGLRRRGEGEGGKNLVTLSH